MQDAAEYPYYEMHANRDGVQQEDLEENPRTSGADSV